MKMLFPALPGIKLLIASGYGIAEQTLLPVAQIAARCDVLLPCVGARTTNGPFTPELKQLR